MLEVVVGPDALASELLRDFHGLIPYSFVDCGDEDLWALLDVREEVFAF